jgi:hypothetical protein
MGRPLYTNNAASALAYGITNTQTTIQVQDGMGNLFPTPTNGDYFYITVTSISVGGQYEIMQCTNNTNDTFTVIRGAEGTTPQFFNIGDNVQLRITAAGMNFITGGAVGTTEEQVFTATQGQTVFTITNFDYSPGTNNLSVYVNGSKQVSGVNYNETSVNVVTFVNGLNAGDVVEFLSGQSTSSGTLYATDVRYNEGSVGAVTTTVQSKLQESVSIGDFGGSLSTAIAGIGSTPTTLIINESITVSSSVTVPFTCAIQVTNESVITVGTGTLITINGPFNAGMCQAFTYTDSTSSVVFGQGTKQVIPQWWGATGNGSTNSTDITNETDAMIACFCSVRHAFITSDWANNSTLGPSTVFIPRGVYAINRPLPVFLNVHVTGEGGNNSPLSFLVQQDVTQPIFEMIPQAYNPNWTVAYETVSTGTIYSIGFGSYQSATQSATNAPAINFNSIRQATTYCNANFGASGGSSSSIGGYSDLHFKYVRFVNVAGYCMAVNDCQLDTAIHDCVFDNSFGGINATGSAFGSVVMQHSSMFTMPGSAVSLQPTSGTGFSFNTFDGTYYATGYIGNNVQSIAVVNPSFASGSAVTIDSCQITGYTYGSFEYRSGISTTNVNTVRIQNNILSNLDAPGSAKYIATAECQVVKINGNIFESDALATYTDSRFIDLYNNLVTNWSIDITNNQFYNYNASAFTNVIAADSDYSSSEVTFSFNIVNGPVTTVLATNVSLINQFGNVGTAFPALLYAGGPPGAYTWKVGDIVYNTTPTSGGNIGWVCTTAGSPGTWETFGTIS